MQVERSQILKGHIIYNLHFLQDAASDEENDEVDEDSPPRRKKSRRDVDLPKKKKKTSKQEEVETKKSVAKKKGGGLSQLLGKRRCAAEANERIARVVNQVKISIVFIVDVRI